MHWKLDALYQVKQDVNSLASVLEPGGILIMQRFSDQRLYREIMSVK
jgi:hypothetical protein